MIKITFKREPYDFRNVQNVIGPFHLEDDIKEGLYFDIIDELEFGLVGVGVDGYRIEVKNDEDFIVIDDRISCELDHIIKDILKGIIDPKWELKAQQ